MGLRGYAFRGSRPQSLQCFFGYLGVHWGLGGFEIPLKAFWGPWGMEYVRGMPNWGSLEPL